MSTTPPDNQTSLALRKATPGLTRPEIITRAELRRNRIAELVLEDKTEPEIAEIVGCHRVQVARLKVDARTQQRIAYLLEQQKVTGDEVRATLSSQMRADITDLYDDDGELRLETIRSRNLGHLIKKLKRTRRMEKRDGELVAVDEIEVELNGQQSAAAQLSKIMRLEEPAIDANNGDNQAAIMLAWRKSVYGDSWETESSDEEARYYFELYQSEQR